MRHIQQILFGSRTTSLVVWLLILMVVGPMLSGKPYHNIAVAVLLSVIPVAGIYAVSSSRRYTFIGLAFGLPSIIAILLTVLGDGGRFARLVTILSAIYYSATTIMILRHLFRHRRITIDTLMGAAAVYLLVGLTFAILYLGISVEHPGSIVLPAHIARFELGEAVYFSMVTLTTLGYGDILPGSSATRSLVIFESACGVLYLAMVISRFVSLYQDD